MATATTTDLDPFYRHVRERGYLRTDGHARRWTQGTLKTLGFHLDRRTKKALANALPDSLAQELGRLFWLLHFRESQLSAEAFQRQVGRRVGVSDAQFARTPILAVFAGIKSMIDDELSRRVAGALSPEVRRLWDQA